MGEPPLPPPPGVPDSGGAAGSSGASSARQWRLAPGFRGAAGGADMVMEESLPEEHFLKKIENVMQDSDEEYENMTE